MDSILRGPLREVLNSGLLVDEDRALVEERLQSGMSYQSSKSVTALFILFGAVIYSLHILSEPNGYAHLGLKIFFNVYVVVGLYALHNLLLPLVVRISTWQFGRVDFRYHQFIAQLRKTETSIYGIQQQIGDSSEYVYASESRRRCVENLRILIERAREYEREIPSEVPPLLEEFIEDDLYLLIKMDGEIRTEHLKLDALKALWQFMYLQRSELLRNFAIHHQDECLRHYAEGRWFSLLHFSRSSLVGFVKFAWNASKFDVHLDTVKSAKRNSEQRRFKVDPQPDSKRVITQLEFLLSRLYQDESVSMDKVSEVLISIASSIQRPKATRHVLINQVESEPQEVYDEQPPITESNEYEVYEAVGGNGDSIAEYDGDYTEEDPFIERRHDLQAELKHVLVERRRIDQELEINALAKRRNKAVDEVRKELELESRAKEEQEDLMTTLPQPSSFVSDVHTLLNESNAFSCQASLVPTVNQGELINALRKRLNNQAPHMEIFSG